METKKKSKCRHHWVIDPPTAGPVSKGICKYCGATKDFSNVIPEGTFREGFEEIIFGASKKAAKRVAKRK